MATVTYPDGRTLEVDDSDSTLLDYYRGEGATVVLASAAAMAFPATFDGEKYVGQQVNQLPDGEYAQGDGVEHEHPGTGEPSVGIEAPADGTPVEISNPPASLDLDTPPPA